MQWDFQRVNIFLDKFLLAHISGGIKFLFPRTNRKPDVIFCCPGIGEPTKQKINIQMTEIFSDKYFLLPEHPVFEAS